MMRRRRRSASRIEHSRGPGILRMTRMGRMGRMGRMTRMLGIHDGSAVVRRVVILRWRLTRYRLRGKARMLLLMLLHRRLLLLLLRVHVRIGGRRLRPSELRRPLVAEKVHDAARGAGRRARDVRQILAGSGGGRLRRNHSGRNGGWRLLLLEHRHARSARMRTRR